MKKELRELLPTKRPLTVKETAEYMSMAPRTIYNQIWRGVKKSLDFLIIVY